MFCWSASREWFNGCGEACSEVHPRPKPKSSTARRRPRNLLRGAPTPGAAVLDHEAAAAQRGPRCAPQDIHARNRAGVLQENRQVHHGRIWGVNAEGPAGELAVHFRHDVLLCAAASTPILSTMRWAIQCELCGRQGAHGGHEAPTLQNLSWRTLVSGARQFVVQEAFETAMSVAL